MSLSVTYPWLPPPCLSCNDIGHTESLFPKVSKEAKAKKEASISVAKSKKEAFVSIAKAKTKAYVSELSVVEKSKSRPT